ncbi:hypothetical protein ACFFNY_11795 [Paenibacillus hodogayensis]|uniref:DUF1080 domain-containing protein n=1 Tax=Paenibacillus hodogayensis TaxID=279208 RepID=A0ABV5VVR3_9BACL
MSMLPFRKLERFLTTRLLCLCLLAALVLPSAAYADDPLNVWDTHIYGNTQGSALFGSDSFAIKTNGSNVWGAADEFTFVSRQMPFLFDECSRIVITAKIDSIEDFQNLNAAAGPMFRDSDTPESKNVMWRVLPDGGLRFTYRLVDGGPSSNVSGPKLTFPVELKLVRQGNIFTSFYKQDGVWKTHKYIQIDMGTNVMAGVGAFSITSHPITAHFSNVSVAGEDDYTPPDGEYVDPGPVTDHLLLRDNFEDGSVTNKPASVTNPLWDGVKLACIVKEPDGNHVWKRNGMNGIVLAGSKAWTDYEASLDVRFDPASAGKNVAELVVRGRKTVLFGDFYYAAGFADGNKLVLEKASAGGATRVKEAAIGSYVDGVIRTLKVVVLDNQIEVYVDGALKIRYTDELLPNLKGAVGIRTEESFVTFDNVVVNRIDDPLGGNYDNEVGGNFDKPAPVD